MNTLISETFCINNQVHNVLQQSVSRKDRCKPIYLFHSTIKTCVYGVICFIISGILCIQEVQTQEIEENLLKDKIFKFLEKIPESADNFYIGPLRIHPSLEISGTYDDNVFNTSDKSITANKDRDFYETYKPKISLTLPIRDHSIAFDYRYVIHEYARDYKPSTVNQDRVHRFFGGSINLNFLNGFSVRISDRVSIIRRPATITRRSNQRVQFPDDDPIDEPEDPNEIEEEFGINTPTLPRETTNNNASIAINLPDFFDKLDFSISYSNIDSSYKQIRFKGSDRNDNNFRGKVIITPSPIINITTGFDYTITNYDNVSENDSIYTSIPFDISWHPTVKSTFFLNTSYNRRDYGHMGSSRSRFENYTGYNATLGYRFNVTKRDNLTIKLERSLREQQFQSFTVEDTTTGSTTTFFDNNPYYFTQIDIDWVHRLSTSFSFIFSPTIQHIRFREKEPYPTRIVGVSTFKHEKVDAVRFEIKGRYNAPHRGWFFSEISYRYQDRNSNLVGGDLIKNEAQLSVGLKF